MNKEIINNTDRKILAVLKNDGRATVREIAKQIGIPITTVHNRLKKLKRVGVIKRFTVEFDHEKLGKGIMAFVFVNITHKHLADKQHGIDSLKKGLEILEEIERIYAVTGDIDLILQVRVGTIKELDNFLIRKLRNVPSIEKTSTVVVLEES